MKHNGICENAINDYLHHHPQASGESEQQFTGCEV